MRNLLIVAIGFLPLLLAPLVPYNTVGNLIASILFVSGCVTLLLIPAIFKLAAPWLFSDRDRRRTSLFGPYETAFIAIVAVALVILVFHPTHPINGPLMPVYLLVAVFIAYRAWSARWRAAT